ncbi:MAG: hypothetical protein KME46_34000 [Brasilonema angustatum HA4187-MV1]|jgi:hypothetical protein|nr:hypothetical protein [Brasilonema angustatum HA4187-MV1]
MFKHVYFGLVLGSTLLGAVGLVQSFHTQGLTQKIAGTIGIGGATTALTALGLGIAYNEKNSDFEREFKQKLDDNSKLKDRELAGLKLQIDELKSRIKVLEVDKETNLKQISELQEKLNVKAEEYLKAISAKDIKIKALQDVVDAKDTRIEDFLEDCKKHTVTFFSLRYNNLDAIQKALEKADVSDEIRISFDKRLRDIASLKQDLTDAMVEIKKLNLTDFKEILDYIFEFDNKFLNVKTRWKDAQVKNFKSESQSLKTSLQASIPKEDARARIRGAMDEVDERITEKYEALLLNNNSIHSQLLDLLEQRNLVIDDLTKQNEELQKPLLATGDYYIAEVANTVSLHYYNRLGYKLDFITWDESETGYTITYAIRKNPGVTDTELFPGNTRELLASECGAFPGTLPKFEFNYQNCSITLIVTTKKAIKKEQAKGDIDKIWIPVEKFESYVKNWERVRITAGSTGGKSPTAKNLALAIMRSRKGQGEIRLYDPQDGSKKDYWDMPKTGTTHADNVAGMEALCDLLDQRSKSKANHRFVLFIFDEVDSTIAQERENNGYYYFRDKVTYSLKQASHQNIGAIYIGQACDASTISGMSWSDWNNAVQLHIGANAGIWLDKAKTVTPEDKTKLLEQYRKIQEFCDRKNEELGLDIFTDPGAYRFALAVPLTGLPKFIQLPDFDTYDYYEIMGDGSSNPQELITSVIEPIQEKVLSGDALLSVKCPECESDNVVNNGMTQAKTPVQKYLCKECGHKFTAKHLIN